MTDQPDFNTATRKRRTTFTAFLFYGLALVLSATVATRSGSLLMGVAGFLLNVIPLVYCLGSNWSKL